MLSSLLIGSSEISLLKNLILVICFITHLSIVLIN